jgi:hypothetical protein
MNVSSQNHPLSLRSQGRMEVPEKTEFLYPELLPILTALV